MATDSSESLTFSAARPGALKKPNSHAGNGHIRNHGKISCGTEPLEHALCKEWSKQCRYKPIVHIKNEIHHTEMYTYSRHAKR